MPHRRAIRANHVEMNRTPRWAYIGCNRVTLLSHFRVPRWVTRVVPHHVDGSCVGFARQRVIQQCRRGLSLGRSFFSGSTMTSSHRLTRVLAPYRKKRWAGARWPGSVARRIVLEGGRFAIGFGHAADESSRRIIVVNGLLAVGIRRYYQQTKTTNVIVLLRGDVVSCNGVVGSIDVVVVGERELLCLRFAHNARSPGLPLWCGLRWFLTAPSRRSVATIRR